MKESQSSADWAVAWMHRHLLWLLISAYVVAGLAPELGLAIRDVGLGRVDSFGTSTQVSLPLLLLGSLLFNAGLGVRADRLRGLVRDPRLLLLGLGANVLVPIAFLHGIAPALGLWHDSRAPECHPGLTERPSTGNAVKGFIASNYGEKKEEEVIRR